MRRLFNSQNSLFEAATPFLWAAKTSSRSTMFVSSPVAVVNSATMLLRIGQNCFGKLPPSSGLGGVLTAAHWSYPLVAARRYTIGHYSALGNREAVNGAHFQRDAGHCAILAAAFGRLGLAAFAKNSSTARRTSADTGASDSVDSLASCFACGSVSHTTVLFMLR